MNTKILIPARFGSSRLPGKPCMDICGRPAIQWVIDQCIETGFPVTLLTDDDRVARAAGGRCEIRFIKDECENGTERCCLSVDKIDGNEFLIVAGDELCIRSEWLVRFVLSMKGWDLGTILTGRAPYSSAKVSADGYVVSIERADGRSGYEATGIYWYDRVMLQEYAGLPGGQAIELNRMVENGYQCKAYHEPHHPGVSLNESGDIRAIEEWLVKSGYG